MWLFLKIPTGSGYIWFDSAWIDCCGLESLHRGIRKFSQTLDWTAFLCRRVQNRVAMPLERLSILTRESLSLDEPHALDLSPLVENEWNEPLTSSLRRCARVWRHRWRTKSPWTWCTSSNDSGVCQISAVLLLRCQWEIICFSSFSNQVALTLHRSDLQAPVLNLLAPIFA